MLTECSDVIGLVAMLILVIIMYPPCLILMWNLSLFSISLDFSFFVLVIIPIVAKAEVSNLF